MISPTAVGNTRVIAVTFHVLLQWCRGKTHYLSRRSKLLTLMEKSCLPPLFRHCKKLGWRSIRQNIWSFWGSSLILAGLRRRTIWSHERHILLRLCTWSMSKTVQTLRELSLFVPSNFIPPAHLILTPAIIGH